MVFAISFATLVFSGPDAPEGALAAGTGFVLWSGLVGASGVALRSSLPAIAEVQDGPSAIFAIMAAAIFGAEGVDDAAKLPTLEAAILATTTASGALMMALGRAKLGNIVRLLPSPVTGGFLAGTGWVLSTGAFKVLTGLAFSVDNVVVAAKSPELFTVVAPGVALGVALAVGNRKIGKFWVVPAFLGGGVAAYFAGLDVALGLTPDDALAAGYLLGPFATDAVSGSFQPLLFSPETLAKVRWDVVLDQGPRAATVFGLSTLGLLLITSAVEVSTEREGDANEELKAVGLANVVSGLGGGLVSYHSLSSTQIAHGMGSSSRLPGVVAAAVYAAALVVGPAPLAYVPRALIGGLLTFIGASFLYEWIVEGRENLPRSEFAVVLLIVVTVASQGYLAGVVAGVLGAAAVFVSDYSRVPIVRSRLRVGGRGGIRSSAPRSRADVDVLIERGAGVYGAKLQGFLFFATAYTLLEEIKTEHARLSAESNGERPMTHVLLDFASVVGVDGSAISVFEKLRRFAARENVALVLSDVDRRELARVVTITLYGEDRPTFAFVDRADPNTIGLQTDSLAPSLEGSELARSGDVLASDVTGRYVKTRDLDAALKFAEASLIAEVRDDARDDHLGEPIGDWTGEPTEEDEEGGWGGVDGGDFERMVRVVCETREEETVFRRAWEPVAFREGEVVCDRGEVADRIYWIETAVVKVDLARGKMSEEDGEKTTSEDGDGEGKTAVTRDETETKTTLPTRTFRFGSSVDWSVDASVDDDEKFAGTTTKNDAESGSGSGSNDAESGSNDASIDASNDDEKDAASASASAASDGVRGMVAKTAARAGLSSLAAGAASLAATATGLDPTGLSQIAAVSEMAAGLSNVAPVAAAAGGVVGAAAAASANRGDDEGSETAPKSNDGDVGESFESGAGTDEREFAMSVTRDFIGAVGFYRRGGVGNVRFGRTVVEKSGRGYCIRESDVRELEEHHPALALRLHKLMAGTLANQVVSRNKLLTQYVK